MAGKALIVEDQATQAEIMEMALKDRFPDFEVFTAKTGQQAMEIIKNERPNLLLLNLYLGPREMSGLRILREAKANDPEIIIYVLTGWDDASFKARALAGGARDYILKPINLEEVLGILEKVADEIRERLSSKE